MEYLFAVFSGKEKAEGYIRLNGITSEQCEIYKKNIDVITDSFFDSTLSVINFSKMYCMLSGIYSKNTLLNLEEELEKYQLAAYKDSQMNQLKLNEQLMVRLLLSRIKKTQLLILYNIAQINETRKIMVQLMRRIMLPSHCSCLLFEKEESCTTYLADKILYL